MIRQHQASTWFMGHVLSFALTVAFCAGVALAHDPGASGGMFRSRDAGMSWDTANPGRIVSAAIGLAISPTDINHLLLATDAGLLRSRNGGRDWTVEAPKVLDVVFAVAFDLDGRRALASTASGLFRSDEDGSWRKMATPGDVFPVRLIVPGGKPGRVYLAGGTGLVRSDDWGTLWSTVGDGLPATPPTALLLQPGPPETVYTIVGGRTWIRSEGSPAWRRLAGATAQPVEALAVDPKNAARIWAVQGGRIFRSNDGGEQWQPEGRPLPTSETAVRGLAVNDRLFVMTTDRGMFRSPDSGETWEMVTDNLPAHLESGPLVQDPVRPTTLYAGFALVPYSELWRGALEAQGSLGRFEVGGVWLWGALAAIGVCAVVIGVRRATRFAQPSADGVAAPRGMRPQFDTLLRALATGVGRALRQPLMHFLLLGAMFFLVNRWTGGGGGAGDRRIEVSPAQQVRLTKAFAEQRGRPPMPAEMTTAIHEYVQEEILYREALEMGLDRGDLVVRRRLVQKLATLLDDLGSADDPTESELRSFFESHADRYAGSVRVRFTQLFFDAERRGDGVEGEARAALEKLRSAQRLSQSIPERGDPFPLRFEDSLRSQNDVAELLGPDFARTIVAFPAGVWQGPVRSKTGYHLVRVDERVAPVVPTLEMVRSRVVTDWRRARSDASNAAALARLRSRYEVIVAKTPGTETQNAKAGGAR